MPASFPRATYRLQLRGGVDFDYAAGIVPYLARLGVSHVYASPVFQAQSGSAHGYDVVDHGRLDPALGGEEGFRRFAEAVRAAGLGLIIDIVPNHMAASPENPWWRDVLRHGRHSAYAGHFDIDWSAPNLLLPVLDRPWGRALEEGAIGLGREADGPALHWAGAPLPLDPRTWHQVLGPAGLNQPIDEPASAPEQFAAWVAEPETAAQIDRALEAASNDRALLAAVHDAQPWRLAYWRAARDALTHRRFFEIADLVGVRVEDPRVFDDVHRRLFELLDEGLVHGVRVDHVDGLSDPRGYLERLRAEAPGTPPIWVEKILGAEERLPAQWPVVGTTGYEHARAVAGLLIDPAGEGPLTEAYHDYIGEVVDPAAMLTAAKNEVLTFNLAGELERLTGLAARVAAGDPVARDWGPDTLRRALVALATAIPVYRTYLGADGAASEDDAAVLAQIEHEGNARVTLEDPGAVSDLVRLLRESPAREAAELRSRFQQTTSALMAKSMEDTLFYRYHRLLAANEVGSEPHHVGLEPDDFDRAIERRTAGQPWGLNATATHDTKRGEDARMRIAAISEAPTEWRDAVDAFDETLVSADQDVPEAAVRWHFYQALLGAWESADHTNLAERLEGYMIKAEREAQLRTSWTAPESAHEDRVVAFVHRALLEVPQFAPLFEARAQPFLERGIRKSLLQLMLKMTLPGVPDIYQGTEWADLSLVDPDNRRPIDFAARDAMLETGPSTSATGFAERKMALMRELLSLRAEWTGLFERGNYQPVHVGTQTSGRYHGFMREYDGAALLVLAELSPPAARESGRPAFALPSEWRSVPWKPTAFSPGLQMADGAIEPTDGFRDAPWIVALASR